MLVPHPVDGLVSWDLASAAQGHSTTSTIQSTVYTNTLTHTHTHVAYSGNKNECADVPRESQIKKEAIEMAKVFKF